MDVVGGFSATSNAITIIKALKDADSSLDAATLKAQLAEALGQLADAKISQIEQAELISALQSEIDRLKTADSDIAQLIERDGYRYDGENDQPIGWPACPTCLTNEKKIVFLVEDGGFESSKCPVCHNKFFPVPKYLPSGSTARQARDNRRKRMQEEQNQRLREHGRNLGGY